MFSHPVCMGIKFDQFSSGPFMCQKCSDDLSTCDTYIVLPAEASHDKKTPAEEGLESCGINEEHFDSGCSLEPDIILSETTDPACAHFLNTDDIEQM